MKVLVLGGAGMLGTAVAEQWRARGARVEVVTRDAADVRDAAGVARLATSKQPDWIINCAAMTRVDDCEASPELAIAVNDTAVGHVVAAAAHCGARLLHVSTDYVFDGQGRAPYREDDPTGPLSVYGSSKLGGERRALAYPGALVIRVSWLFGPGGANFARTIATQVVRGQAPLRVVADQIGCPTSTASAARAFWDLAAADARGLVHYRDREPVSWHGFARRIVAELGSERAVEAVPTRDFPRPARRPAYSVLAVERFEALTGRRVEDWQDGLRHYLRQLHQEEMVRT